MCLTELSRVLTEMARAESSRLPCLARSPGGHWFSAVPALLVLSDLELEKLITEQVS